MSDNTSSEEEKNNTQNEKEKDKQIQLEDSTDNSSSDESINQAVESIVMKPKGLEDEELEPEELGPKFKLVIRNITIRQCTTKSPKIRFTFGGNFKVVDNRHKGGKIETIGEKGKQFTTGKCEVETGGSGGVFKNEFVKYKRFKYEDLEDQELSIELITTGCCDLKTVGSAKINLQELANSHIQREVQTEIHQKGKHKITAKISFHCYFQEIWNFDLHFYQFEGRNLLSKNEQEPDPQIKLKIKSKFINFFKRDKNFQDRDCKSEHELNTKNPKWEEVGNITYRGIFSELENEDLTCEVFNHNTLKKSTKIGESLIEMRGFLDYGLLEGPLVLTSSSSVKNESTGSKEKQITKTEGGSILGLVEVNELPPHRQYGDIVILKPGRQYIGVHLIRGVNLRSADPNGFSDPFVIVEFGGFKQRTKVIYRSLDPIWEETLYFTVKVGLLTEQNIAEKGNIKVMVFDDDEAGDDFLGSCEIELKDIVNSPQGKAGSSYNKCTSRLLNERYSLVYNGEETEQKIDLKAWFQPDVPHEFKFENVKKKQTKTKLSKSFAKREGVWRQGIPENLLKEGDFEIKGADEDYCERFIPTFMFKMELPRDLRDRRAIARTVKCFTYENDEITFGGRRDVWCSPNFFLSLMKGSAEEHAALMVSMYLGLDLDAYLCQGKTKKGDEHYWVMIRENDGTITLIECSTSKEYHLEDKWKGKVEEIELDPKKRKKKKKKKKKKENENEKGNSDDEDSDELEKKKREKKKDSKKSKKIELESSGDEDEKKDEEGEEGEEEEEEEPIKDELILPYMSVEIIANHQNLWANIQGTLDPAEILYDLENKKLWHPFVDPDAGFTKAVKPFYKDCRLGPRIPEGRGKLFATRIRKEVIAGYTNFRHGKNLKTAFLKKFTPVIESGLDYYEKQELQSVTEEDEKNYKIWRGKIAEMCPQGYKFDAFTINFTYTDPTRIRNWIMDKYDFHQDESIDTVFACGAFVQGYFGRVSSVWVMLCTMTVLPKSLDEQEQDEDKDNKKGKKKNKKEKSKNNVDKKTEKGSKSNRKITIENNKSKKKDEMVPLLDDSDSSSNDELNKN
ncbi:centrosomal protein of 76 kda [Anaeramoeba flamelloides]|uniref:Centrosomal protein of 76 kDa n=1 Tax=Anaeramoeba flamelloides TaxID=1746091 RepID=A0ABQ8XHK1_9EUKA|nr:centrosomal protein of 76 kda [Anaeramoeba flamelloides]